MKNISAIGFDLFNTLVMAKPDTLTRAFPRLQQSLTQNGLCPEEDAFKKAYYDADVNGAIAAGIQPVWFTYVLDHKPPIPTLMAPSETDEPHESVLRVSKWSQFSVLLNLS